VALLGTAVAFVVGFKNNASYDRLWEARKLWGGIVNVSRTWTVMVLDYVTNKHAVKVLSEGDIRELHCQLVYRHLAWLTALRYQLREYRKWESVNKKHNLEYRNKWFKVEEHNTDVGEALRPYLSAEEHTSVMTKTNKAAQILALQSAHLRRLLENGYIEDFRHMELENRIAELYNLQGGCERIKNFPYPRQYATLNLWFVKAFIILIPLGMLQEFDRFGIQFVWLSIPFSMLSGWIFTTLEKIGESSESPFEGSANDVPITALSRTIEIDLREMLQEQDVPAPRQPQANILT
jgi:putative membrane protein